jgi:hypothetical protein
MMAATPSHIAKAAAAAAAAVNVETPDPRPSKRERGVPPSAVVTATSAAVVVASTQERSGSPSLKRTRVAEGGEGAELGGAPKEGTKPEANRLSKEKLLERRQVQIDMGKRTAGYKAYVAAVPKAERAARASVHRECPSTPDKARTCSKRSWDGQVRKWRRLLHAYDPEEPPAAAAAATATAATAAAKEE